MNEMKYEYVFKSMLCCLKGECEKCPCKDDRNLYGGAVDCIDILFDNATRIFEEKDAEIERLTAYNANLICANTDITNRHKDYVEEAERIARADAITEFFERVCKEVEQTPNANEFFINAWKEKFEEIAKEMKGN